MEKEAACGIGTLLLDLMLLELTMAVARHGPCLATREACRELGPFRKVMDLALNMRVSTGAMISLSSLCGSPVLLLSIPLPRSDISIPGHSLELLVAAELKRLVNRCPEHGLGGGGLYQTRSNPGSWFNHLCLIL